MWLMASEVPVRLEILDQTGQTVFGAAARLTHLDESHALISLEEPESAARLHWGAPVRFELEDGMQRYEITGAIVAQQEEEAAPAANETASDASAAPMWEVRVRIWECKLNVQRRSLPRRKLRFKVHLRPATDTEDARVVDSTEAFTAWCVDIGAGGMRIRTDKLKTVPKRIRLEFCLPVSDGAHGIETSHTFCVGARVIRSTPHGRHGDSTEIALCFEGLSVRDGFVLHNLLT